MCIGIRLGPPASLPCSCDVITGKVYCETEVLYYSFFNFRHLWVHFFAWANDWSSYSRYIWSSLVITIPCWFAKIRTVFLQDCQNSHVSNKRLYPNFARTNPQHSRAAFKILDLLKEKSWTQVNVVYQTSRKWIVFKRFLLRLLKRKGVEVRRRLRIKPLAFALEEVSIPELVSTVTSKSQGNICMSHCIDLSKNDVKCGKFMLHEIWLALQ